MALLRSWQGPRGAAAAAVFAANARFRAAAEAREAAEAAARAKAAEDAAAAARAKAAEDAAAEVIRLRAELAVAEAGVAAAAPPSGATDAGGVALGVPTDSAAEKQRRESMLAELAALDPAVVSALVNQPRLAVTSCIDLRCPRGAHA